MSYWDRPTSTSNSQVDSLGISISKNGNKVDEFYEIEAAVVLDIILDKNHPFFSKSTPTIDADQWPINVLGQPPKKTDPDYTWMGRALVRLLYSQRNIQKEDLIWALPLENNISEYPLLNEQVGIVSYFGKYYYTKKINSLNTPNTNADFSIEINNGGFKPTQQSPTEGNRELLFSSNDVYRTFQGPTSKLSVKGGSGMQGVLGRYFYFNDRIRSVKRREGDLIVESRFGQSIRFAGYDDNRDNDKGYNSDTDGYDDYKRKGIKYKVNDVEFEAGGGNPMILIRNRQKPVSKTKEEEKNVGGYVIEDVNNDGTSIHITSGVTKSEFKTTCLKKMWGIGEEQPSFLPKDSTQFKFPKLIGDQLVINSDRIVISSKMGEIFNFSKKRYAVVTDDEYTVDAHNQIIFTTNNKTVINSPAIYLGEYGVSDEPVLLGQTTVNWLYDLCGWLLEHTHWHKHSHPNAGQANPDKTQTTIQAQTLISLRDRLGLLMSRRVFVTGGGFAPGKNGEVGDVKNGSLPLKIGIPSGQGLPGGFKGSNKR